MTWSRGSCLEWNPIDGTRSFALERDLAFVSDGAMRTDDDSTSAKFLSCKLFYFPLRVLSDSAHRVRFSLVPRRSGSVKPGYCERWRNERGLSPDFARTTEQDRTPGNGAFHLTMRTGICFFTGKMGFGLLGLEISNKTMEIGRIWAKSRVGNGVYIPLPLAPPTYVLVEVYPWFHFFSFGHPPFFSLHLVWSVRSRFSPLQKENVIRKILTQLNIFHF